jgi:PAS domain S-box-containing protein
MSTSNTIPPGRIHELEKELAELRATTVRQQEETQWLRKLIEESRDGIVILDTNAKVFDANQAFARMLGYTREEVRRLHAWDWDAVFTREQIQGMAHNVDVEGHHFETRHRRKDGVVIDVELSNNGAVFHGQKLIFCISRDISDRKRAQAEREELIGRLQDSLAEIKTLRGILPLCSYCKKIRDDKGYWEQVDVYIHQHSEAGISHSICPDCMREHFPDIHEEILREQGESDLGHAGDREDAAKEPGGR